MRNIPDTPYHFSDHEGVAADFTVKRNVTGRHFTIIIHCAVAIFICLSGFLIVAVVYCQF